jgi:hypothetical protein
VIDVGVRQHYGVNAGGIKEKIPVPAAGLVALALIQAAIEEEALAPHADQMLRTGYGLDGSVKTNLHQVTSRGYFGCTNPATGSAADFRLPEAHILPPELKAAHQALGI